MVSKAILIAKLALNLEEAILNKDIDTTSPISMISKGMEFLSTVPEMAGATKKEILVQALERIAMGKDGIVGTDDDIISAEYIKVLRIMIDNNIVEGIINVISDAAKGKFNLATTVSLAHTAGTTCIPHCIEAIFKSKKHMA